MKSSIPGVEPAVSGEGALEITFRARVHKATRRLSRQMQWRLFSGTLIVNDVTMIALAFRLAYFVRFELSIPIFVLSVNPSMRFYQRVVLALIPVWLLIFAASGLYNRQNLLGGIQEYSMIFRATTVGLLLVVVAGFLEPVFIIARGWLLLAWIFAFVLVATGRFWLRRLIYSLRRQGYYLTPALILGANGEARALAEQLVGWKTSGLHVMGFVDDKTPVGTLAFRHLSILGRIERLDEIIAQYGIEELILASSAFSREEMLTVFKDYGFSNDVSLRLSSGLFELVTTGLQVKELAYVPLVRVNKVRLTGGDRILKLLLDYGLTIPLVLALSPLMALIALAVKLDSPGPIIFRRRVMGVNGRRFDAFKFRTMYMNGAEILAAHPELKAELAKTHKLKDDPRVTRLGNFLRKYSLDELPQLINVLRHEMALVGPRMISPAEVKMYNQWGLNLLTVRPGITGLWQVSGRSDITYAQRVRLDMHYVRNWTIWLDLQLLMRTIPVVFKGRGAY